MRGERGSTARQRIAGKICCNCRRLLTPNGRVGERYCETCGPRLAVLMRFEEFKGEWIVNFSEGNRGVGRTRVIRSDASILEMVKRGRGDLAATQEGLRERRGVVTLSLNAEQYAKLRQ